MQFFCSLLLFLLLCVCSNSEVKYKKYESNWDSLDTRPLPAWFDKAKFGIFIHWGVFSVPSFGSEWFWNFWITQNYSGYVNFMKKNYPPKFSYQDFAKDFTAEFYDPEYWAEVFQNSGAKYIVLTSKHHEGYTLWPSKTAFGWNAMDVGPHRDITGELANAIRSKTDLHFGLYHSLFEWYNPLYLQDKRNNYTTQYFVLQKTLPELYELVEEYQPDIIWSDGSIESTYEYWKATEFIAWLYNESPNKETVVVNDRWGKGMNGKHGDFYTYTDRYNPGVLLPHKWENCDTIDKLSFGYRRNAKLSDYRTTEELIGMLAKTVSCGGNLLLNIAPTKEGIITPIYEERLRSMGSWLRVNAEAVYESVPWIYQNDTQNPHVWYTSRDRNVYAIVLEWPKNRVLSLGAPETTDQSTITLLGYPHALNWSRGTDATLVHFPSRADVSTEWSWVLKITDLGNRF